MSSSLSSAVICEPLKDGVLLTTRLASVQPRRVLLIFWHGLGDLLMFINPFTALTLRYPDIEFTIGVAEGLGFEDILSVIPGLRWRFVTGDEVNQDELTAGLGFDLVAKITFPMNEGQQEFTKGEWCCLHELGIEPQGGHVGLAARPSPLVAVHFQITCLPESANPDAATAEQVWNDVLAAGCVPLEVHFQHVFHNPINTKFDFIDATVRRAQARVRSLVGLIQSSRAFVGVVSGPFHVALSVLPPERILLLEKDFKRGSFTKHGIATADLRHYHGEVKAFLEKLDG